MAGPVVAGAVLLPDAVEAVAEFSGLTDSKQLTGKERLRFEELIKRKAVAWSLGFVWPDEIDRSDILRATFLAMSMAFASMMAKGLAKKRAALERGLPEQVLPPIPAQLILIDGNQTLPTGVLQAALKRWGLGGEHIFPQQTVVKGDSKVLAIAAASVLAKVGRDRLMQQLDRKYPEFGFARHKGYGTKEHFEAIKKYGVTRMHRQSFQGCRSEDTEADGKPGKAGAGTQSLLLPS